MKEEIIKYAELNKLQKLHLIKFTRKIYPNISVRDIIQERYVGLVKESKLIGVGYQLP